MNDEMTLPELAAYLRTSERAALSLPLPVLSEGETVSSRRWSRQDVDRWLEKQITESVTNLRRGAEEASAVRSGR